jgi:bacterioferritin (cytochrome b1)
MKRTRRHLLQELSAFALTGTALTLAIGANHAEARRGYDPRTDIYYLNKALKQEHEVILSYDFSIETGLFEKTAMGMFNLHIADHLQHREMLSNAIKRLGGIPIAPIGYDEFKKNIEIDLIRTGSDALRFNLRYEGEAYVIYSEIATYMQDPSLVAMTAMIGADEMLHKSMLVRAIPSVPYDPTLRIPD